ncbi:MAG: acyl-CoA reductase [Chitinophagales bacterium]
MQAEERIKQIIEWGECFLNENEGLENAMEKAWQENRWFIHEHQKQALKSIKEQMLSANKLEHWINHYNSDLMEKPAKNIALIMAGNIPLVGFHDLLAVLMSGNKAQVKLSSKDSALWKYLFAKMQENQPALHAQIEVVERLKDFDAVIATGGNNTSRYFEYYFGKYPHIIRKNRNSLAIISGNESDAELMALGNDVFGYFGLGCRNISHLLVPENYDFKQMLDVFESYKWVLDNNKYKNNFDYQLSIMLLNQIPFLQGDAILLKASDSIPSPIATLHYQFYKSREEAEQILKAEQNKIQCVVGENHLGFGTAQSPGLMDYADGVDTMKFLLDMKK